MVASDLVIWAKLKWAYAISRRLSTSSQDRLKESTSNLAQMFLTRSQPSVVTFEVDPKIEIAGLW